MANEAVLKLKQDEAIDFIVADGVGIEKGAILESLDGRTASGAALHEVAVAGICAREKIANDGRTRVAVFRRGIFDLTASGAVVIGNAVTMAGGATNKVQAAESSAKTSSGGIIIGTSLETAADGEVFEVEVNVR